MLKVPVELQQKEQTKQNKDTPQESDKKKIAFSKTL